MDLVALMSPAVLGAWLRLARYVLVDNNGDTLIRDARRLPAIKIKKLWGITLGALSALVKRGLVKVEGEDLRILMPH